MSEAIIKVSWRVRSGRVDPASVAGGVSGSVFSLKGGPTLTAAQVARGLFVPNPGSDRCLVAIAASDGCLFEVGADQVLVHDEWEVAEIINVMSASTYRLSNRGRSSAFPGLVKGYEARVSPFGVSVVAGTDKVRVGGVNVAAAAKSVRLETVHPVALSVSAADMVLDAVPGFVADAAAGMGLGGAPLLDADGDVVGVCVLGLPPDSPTKTQIGAVDVRAMLGVLPGT